uniref:SCP domain-containing protein n=1 Tax=Mesocestoides corti TaxID=53468 RepID=A0A5K3FBN9_MESCO
MKTRTLFLLALIYFAVADIPSPNERRFIVEAHTKIRESVWPSASDMMLMIVWANSTRVGCARRFCGFRGPGHILPTYAAICQYDPMEGIKKKRPYKEGPSCSKCPNGYGCQNKQCVQSH